MAFYEVFAEVISNVHAYVEADSESEAYRYAKKSLGSFDFVEKSSKDFELMSYVLEVEKEEIDDDMPIFEAK